MRAPLIVLDERECLLELVDDEQKLRTVVGKNALDGPEQTELVRRQLLAQRGGRVYRDPQKRGLELLEGICARRRHDDLPTAGPNRRHEPGEHHRRLPAPARPDDGEEASVSHPLDQLRDQLLATEEVLGVGLQERVEPLVRVADLARAAPGPRGPRATDPGGASGSRAHGAPATARCRARRRAARRPSW